MWAWSWNCDYKELMFSVWVYWNRSMVAMSSPVIPTSPECRLLYHCFPTEKQTLKCHVSFTLKNHQSCTLTLKVTLLSFVWTVAFYYHSSCPFTADLLIRQMYKRIKRSVSHFQLQVNWFIKSVKEQNIERHDKVLQSPFSPDKNVIYIIYCTPSIC